MDSGTLYIYGAQRKTLEVRFDKSKLNVPQVLGAVMLMLTGVAMFVCKYNEWIVSLLIACLLELYTAFRIPQELEKEGK